MPTPPPALPTTPPPDPLAGLRDWHLPDPVSWWPPAPGWWLLAALVLSALAYAAWRWQARRRQGAAARAALIELRALRARLGSAREDALEPGAVAAAVSVLLRRLALTRFPRTRVAGLSGGDWLAFLDATGGGGAFTQGPGRLLADLPYRTPGTVAPADALALADLAERWVRARPGGVPARDTQHRPPAPARAAGPGGSPATARRPLPTTGYQPPAPATP